MRKQLTLLLVLLLSLSVAACTRSASESPTTVPGSGTPAVNGGEQQPPSNMETAVAGGGFATQTAQAQVGVGTAEATPAAPGSQPTREPEPTQPPTEEPTPAPPTNTPAAQATSCASPYTVQQGEWVWSIGRKCNISPQAIISANNLACYYDLSGRLQCPLQPGDTLILPANAPPFTGP